MTFTGKFELGFFSRTFSIHTRAGEKGGGGGISLIPHHHFHPLSRHLDISRAITAESLPLHIPSSRSQTVALFRKFGTPLVSEPGTSLNQCIKVNLWPIVRRNIHSKIVPELVS